MAKVENKVYRLKKDFTLMEGMDFKRGEEFQIVVDVVYMRGNMLPPDMQNMFYMWITTNPTLFLDDTRTF